MKIEIPADSIKVYNVDDPDSPVTWDLSLTSDHIGITFDEAPPKDTNLRIEYTLKLKKKHRNLIRNMLWEFFSYRKPTWFEKYIKWRIDLWRVR